VELGDLINEIANYDNNSPVMVLEVSTHLMPNPANGHDPESV
jgi:hypothetical protein